MTCGPGGEVLAQASADHEELLIADLPRESAGTYLADRRAELYGSRASFPDLRSLPAAPPFPPRRRSRRAAAHGSICPKCAFCE